MGDSLLSWNRATGNSVSHNVENLLGEPVVDRSVPGARVIYGLPISGAAGLNITKQYRDGPWDWVILNGGGNDLWLGCACSLCDRKMGKLISPNGMAGTIPNVVDRARIMGARVIYVGYLRSPGRGSVIEHCKDEGDELERRVSQMADRDPGVYYLKVGDLVPFGDRSFHAFDMIHPSVKGSAAIAQRIVDLIRSERAATPG